MFFKSLKKKKESLHLIYTPGHEIGTSHKTYTVVKIDLLS